MARPIITWLQGVLQGIATGPQAGTPTTSAVPTIPPILTTPLDGFKTYLAAAGLLGLALYQLSQSDVVHAAQSALAALAAFGLRHALDNTPTPPSAPSPPVLTAPSAPAAPITPPTQL